MKNIYHVCKDILKHIIYDITDGNIATIVHYSEFFQLTSEHQISSSQIKFGPISWPIDLLAEASR
jgi:hypothetical protein